MQWYHQLVEHQSIGLSLVAVAIAVAGCLLTTRLWRLAVLAEPESRIHLSFFTGITAGSSFWATDTVFLLAHAWASAHPPSGHLSFFAATVGGLGCAIAVYVSTVWRKRLGRAGSAGILGMAILTSHLLTIDAFHLEMPSKVDAVISVSFLLAACGLAVHGVNEIFSDGSRRGWIWAALSFSAALVLVHAISRLCIAHTHPADAVVPADIDGSALIAAEVILFVFLMFAIGLATASFKIRANAHQEGQLILQARRDSLTGLPNRRMFLEQLEAQCEGLAGGDADFILMLVDLDRFKMVNDALGHPTGDELLRRVGSRLKSVVGDAGEPARLGGDEFALLLKPKVSLEKALLFADQIVEIMQRPFMISGELAEIGASLGIAAAPLHGTDTDTLVKNADVALYTAKEAGRSAYRVFQPGMMTKAQLRRALETDLRRAITREELSVFYQPLVDPATGVCTGAEALLRWHHRERGWIAPSEFIQIAEEIGVINQLGSWALKQACIEAAGWPAHYNLAVNASAKQLEFDNYIQAVADALAASGLDAHRLEIEITETALLCESDVTKKALARLKHLGVSIVLDDFGTGYSSLTYLSMYPIDRLKIDRSFFAGLENDPGRRTLVKAIAELGQTLNIAVTAEGVETSDQNAFAADCGCSPVQGFLHGHAVPAQQLPASFHVNQLVSPAA